MEKVKKFDIHVHSYVWENRSLPCDNIKRHILPHELRHKYDSMGIERGVLLASIDEDYSIMELANKYSSETAQKYPDLFAWFCGVDPRIIENNPKIDFSAILDENKKMGAKGVGELCTPIQIDGEIMDRFYSSCEECDMPIIIHLQPIEANGYGLRDTLGLPGLENVLKRHPKLKVFGHSAMFWSHIGGEVTLETMDSYTKGRVTPNGAIIRMLREYDNLYCDMSASSGENAFFRDTEFAYKMIDEFQDRLLFGTDIGGVTTKRRLADWLDESAQSGLISETAYRKISRENAMRLLNLD